MDSPLARRLSALLSLCVVLPGPLWAQTVSQSVTAGPAAGVSALGAAPIAAPGAATALPLNPATLAPVSPSVQAVNLVGAAQNLALPASIAGSAAAAETRVAAARVPAAAPTALAAGAVQRSEAARVANSPLALVAQALAGVRQAAAALPGIGRLAAPFRAPDPLASADDTRAQAERHFDAKLGVDAEDGNPLSLGAMRIKNPVAVAVDAKLGLEGEGFDPLSIDLPNTIANFARTPGGIGTKPGHKKAKPKPKPGDEEETPDPQYKARDIRLNDAVLPSVAMRPDRPISPLIVQAIDATKKSLLIAAYEMKDREIVKALRRARDRGVEIKIVLDYTNVFPNPRDDSKYKPHRSTEIQSLLDGGFDVAVLRGMYRYGIQHNKFMVFDGKVAEFGSYNYSWTAEDHHFENAKFTDDAKHVEGFQKYWDYLRQASLPFDKARANEWPTQMPVPPQDDQPSVSFNAVVLPTYFFNPNPASEDWIVKAIDAAQETLDLTMFTLRSTKIAEAILRAKERGVKVRVILDQSQNDSDAVRPYRDWLAYNGVKVRVLGGPDPNGPEWAEKDHNKFMVLDGKLVETGSMNFTKNAVQFNFENGSFTTDKTDAKAYQAFFDDMWKNRAGSFAEAPAKEPTLPSDEELIRELQVAPEPPPAPPQWGPLPEARKISFNGETLPGYAVKPQHPVADIIASAIHAARQTIQIALYEFTEPQLLDALKDAKRRGVKVSIVIDFTHVFPSGLDHTGSARQRSEQIQALIDDGFDVRVVKGLHSTGVMHNKFALFDGKILEAGSYNWSVTAENYHFENIFFSDDAKRVAFYQKYHQYLWDAAVPVEKAQKYDWKNHKPENAPVDTDQAIEFNGQKFPRSAVSPAGMVEENLVRAIEAAKVSVDVAMFSFYSQPIANALLAAKDRGIKVRLAFDEGQSKLMKLEQWFAYHGFDMRIVAGPNHDGSPMFEKMHNKMMLVDGRLLETGSYNYTPNAENNNFDNANFFVDDPMIAAYQAFFDMIFDWGWEPLKPTKPPTAAMHTYFEQVAKAVTGHDSSLE